MRNLAEHPVTPAEILAFLQKQREEYATFTADNPRPGDMTLLLLDEAIKLVEIFADKSKLTEFFESLLEQTEARKAVAESVVTTYCEIAELSLLAAQNEPTAEGKNAILRFRQALKKTVDEMRKENDT